ncbi:phosphatase PAP2 family protein [Streptomyces pinistramenti]|uniref:phosphatase PAP2 family protein n=1 Tax=Streptomyces pinistramenti TaxID=2884812 RepID=UPI001D0848F2|nr:phosphatase PAP2 family protein [Streptomyces pinistramenti]MCB5909110.1 phosphatase PAP2 family protein [Streptomyces pinistramenti]
MTAAAHGPCRRWTVPAGCAAALLALSVAVVVAGPAPFAVDSALHSWAVTHRPHGPAAFARGLTASGTGIWPYLMASAAGIIAGRGARGRIRAAVAALACLATGQAARYGLMTLIARPRPPAADWAAHASGHSFPSGHATTSALAAGLLCGAIVHRARPVAARLLCGVALSWAAAVGLTRIYLGVHWPTDVAAGWLFATVWLAAAAALFGHRGRTRWRSTLPDE